MENLIAIDGVIPSPQVIDQLASHGRPVLLSFSAGKDAVACWLALRDRVEVVPFFCYLVPGLEFVDEGLEYYERFFGRRIIRVPHPSLYRMLAECVFMPPERLSVIRACGLPKFDFGEIEQWLREDEGLPPDTYAANGVRCADSPNRRTMLKRWGSINEDRLKCWPVWDWRNCKLEEEFLRAGVKLTVDYRLFGRSFDGIDYRFLRPIKDHFPRDYERILEWFPMADLELFRAETLTN